MREKKSFKILCIIFYIKTRLKLQKNKKIKKSRLIKRVNKKYFYKPKIMQVNDNYFTKKKQKKHFIKKNKRTSLNKLKQNNNPLKIKFVLNSIKRYKSDFQLYLIRKKKRDKLRKKQKKKIELKLCKAHSFLA